MQTAFSLPQYLIHSVACLLCVGGALVSSAADPERQGSSHAGGDASVVIFDGRHPNRLACDTTLRQVPDGSWVMVMLGGGNREPMPENRVYLSRSLDHGQSWSNAEPIELGIKAATPEVALVPTELMVHGSRCTLFVATHDGSFDDWKAWMTHSEDSCRTWSPLEPVPGRLHHRTFVRNHIVTRDGRILLPFQHYLSVAPTRTSGDRRFSAPTDPRNGVLISRDGGKSWTEHGDIRLTGDDHYHGWAENNLVELGDGRIAMILRADRLGGVLYQAESTDGGETWPTYARRTEIPNPGSKATLYGLGGDQVALLHNPNAKHRSPLALWVSFDGMKHWRYRRVLVPESSDGPQGRLNYPDGFVSADRKHLHFAFDDNRHRAVYYRAALPETPEDDARLTVLHVDPSGDDTAVGTVDRPLRTLARALEQSRDQEQVEIRLSDRGTFFLDEPIRIDGGHRGLRIVGEGVGATLSGGTPVTGWSVAENGLWRARCPVDGEPRELFVHDRRAQRARFPNEGWLRIDTALADRRTGFHFSPGDLPPTLEADSGLELVFLHDWSISRIPVHAIDHDAKTLTTRFPVGCAAPHYAIDHFEKQPRYALEGSPRLLDQPGEWSYSGGEILYHPLPGETLDSLSAVVPRLQQLLDISQDADGKPPADVSFQNLTFSHCRWDTPQQGYAEGQATMHEVRDGDDSSRRILVPCAARVTDAVGIVFDQVHFSHLGGSGLWIGQGTKNCVIQECVFDDVSGNGINLGEQDQTSVAEGIRVSATKVRRCGRQFFGGVGIWVGMARSCTIEGCEIQDLPYTGISIGWRWNPAPSECRDHRVLGNHIHHVMQTLSDGAGIYTLGRQPGTILADNRIHDVPLNAGRAQSNGIFMDEGSTELLVEANTIHAIAKSPIRFHKAGENTIRGNRLSVSTGETPFTFNNTDESLIRLDANPVTRD